MGNRSGHATKFEVSIYQIFLGYRGTFNSTCHRAIFIRCIILRLVKKNRGNGYAFMFSKEIDRASVLEPADWQPLSKYPHFPYWLRCKQFYYKVSHRAFYMNCFNIIWFPNARFQKSQAWLHRKRRRRRSLFCHKTTYKYNLQ